MNHVCRTSERGHWRQSVSRKHSHWICNEIEVTCVVEPFYNFWNNHRWERIDYSSCCCIRLCSLVELIQGGTNGLSVLRTFRLLRILKLVRFLPALKYQLIVMLRTMDNVAMFFALLLLFIFIFRFANECYSGRLRANTLEVYTCLIDVYSYFSASLSQICVLLKEN